MSTWYWPALALVIAGGILPAVYFLWTWRPSKALSSSAIDAGGWVAVVLALYLLAALRGLFGQYRLPETVLEGVLGLLIGAGIDAVLWLRVIRWRAFRRSARDAIRDQ